MLHIGLRFTSVSSNSVVSMFGEKCTKLGSIPSRDMELLNIRFHYLIRKELNFLAKCSYCAREVNWTLCAYNLMQ